MYLTISNYIENMRIKVYHYVHFCTNNNAAYVAVEQTYGDIATMVMLKKMKHFEMI